MSAQSAPVKTCVLGVGLAGLTFHVPFILALNDLFVLHAVLERNPTTPHGKVHARFGVEGVRIHRTLEDVLADDAIELVIVGTPNDTHYEFAKRALNAGKHVLVDKPVTATAAQAEELGALAKSKHLVLYAFQNRRWDADFLNLRRLLALPSSSPHYMGHVSEFESHFDRYRDTLKGTWKDEPRPAAGLTYDLGAHVIDQALALFGRPARLTAFIQNMRGIGSPEVDDTFTILLHYPRTEAHPNGCTAILRAHPLSVRAANGQLRYIVRGTHATYTKYHVDPQEDCLRAIKAPAELLADNFGAEPEDIWGKLEYIAPEGNVKTEVWKSTEHGQYAGLFKDLHGAIRNGATPAVKWEEATAVIEMIELAHTSMKQGKTVEVPKK